DKRLDPVNREWRTQYFMERDCSRLSGRHRRIQRTVRIPGQVGQQDQELVATLPRDNIRVADGFTQARADRLQELVARRVAEAVVDELEVVEVDEHQSHA